MEGRGLRGIFFKNKRLKLMALVFAAVLWFFVAGQSNTEVGFLVPLGLKGIPKDMVVTGVPPAEMEVRVSGAKPVIINLSSSQIIAELDLAGAKEGVNTFNILPEDIITPVGVDVLSIRPKSVEVRLEKLVKTALPVKARLQGAPAPGFRVSGVRVSPLTVDAAGIKKEMQEAGALYTKPVDIRGLQASKSFVVQIDTSPEAFRDLSVDKVSVTVFIEKER